MRELDGSFFSTAGVTFFNCLCKNKCGISYRFTPVAATPIPAFAQGTPDGGFITNGPQLIMVGDNESGVERVDVTPFENDVMPPIPEPTITPHFSRSIVSKNRILYQ